MNTENWDDDFVFNPGSPSNSPRAGAVPRGSVSSSRSDWDAEPDLDPAYDTAPEPVPATPRSKWAEKTPTRKRVASGGGHKHVENGDENENWDDDFEDNDPDPPPPLPIHRLSNVASGSDSDDDFGLLSSSSHTARERDDAEDRTVTRSRPHPNQIQRRRASRASNYTESPPPPVPALPASLSLASGAVHAANGVEPFPAQPVFTPPLPTPPPPALHVKYKEVNPPSPPIPRERRRLRKKSRPSDVISGSDASRRNSVASDSRPQAQSPPPNLPPPPERETQTSPRLLARIGSVKKWNVRRKRGSTEPSALARPDSAASDFSNFTTSTGAPSTYTTSTGGTGGEGREGRSGWFFRSSSGAGGSIAGGSTRTGDMADGEQDPEDAEGSSGHSHNSHGNHSNRALSRPPSRAGSRPPSAMKKQASTRSFTPSFGDPDATPTKANGGLLGMGKRKPSKLFSGLGLVAGPAYPSTFSPPPSLPSALSSASSATDAQKRHVSATSRLSGLSSGISSVGRAASTTLVNASTDSLPSCYTMDKKGSGRWARRLSLVSRAASSVREGREGEEGRMHRRGVSGGGGGVLGAAFVEMQRGHTQAHAQTQDIRVSSESSHRPLPEGDEGGVQGGGLGPPIELHPPSPPRNVLAPAGPDLGPTIQTRLMEHSDANPNGAEQVKEKETRTSPKLTSPITPTAPATARTPRATRSPIAPLSASLGRTTAAPPPSAMSPSPLSPLSTHLENSISTLPGSASSTGGSPAGAVPRRNSLGDLKIPTRISQAQVSLRRDLGLVREFAGSVEQLRTLETSYRTLLASVQSIVDAIPLSTPIPASPPPPVSNTNFFHLSRTGSTKRTTRKRSNTGPVREKERERERQKERERLRQALGALEGKYRISWECAELLIELGGGTPSPTAPASSVPSPLAEAITATTRVPLVSSSSDPAALAPPGGKTSTRRSRERAITLSGDESRSMGRNDLSERQLVILREMLDGDGPRRISEEPVGTNASEGVYVNRGWRWGDAMSSTVTLPPSEGEAAKKRRRGIGMGMGMGGLSGFREMLRAMKKQQAPPMPPVPAEATHQHAQDIISSASESSLGEGVPQRKRGKMSTGPESIRSTQVTSPPLVPPFLAHHRVSPRRPSLASIFRLGQKSKPSSSSDGAASSVDSISISVHHAHDSEPGFSTSEEEDWDRMDSASDLEHAAKALGAGDGLSTVKGKGRSPYLHGQEPQLSSSHLRPVTPKMGPEASRSSIFGGGDAHIRPTRLSNVEENGTGSKALRKGKNRSSLPVPSLSRSKSRMALKSDSVRSAPPQSAELSEFKLAMTPENIKPLLENAREVHVRLEECIAELKVLLASTTPC